MWDVHSLQCLSTLTGHSGAVRALSASSARVFSGSDDTTIKARAPAALQSILSGFLSPALCMLYINKVVVAV